MPKNPPDFKKEPREWKNEREIQNFLSDLSNGSLRVLLGKDIKSIHREVVLPFDPNSKYRTPRWATKGKGRFDIIAIDCDGGWHIVEVKDPKDELLENSKGIAQLLFYDALLFDKQGVNAASLTLATSVFDQISKEIVPRNKLNIRIAKIGRKAIEVITSFEHKESGLVWHPNR